MFVDGRVTFFVTHGQETTLDRRGVGESTLWVRRLFAPCDPGAAPGIPSPNFGSRTLEWPPATWPVKGSGMEWEVLATLETGRVRRAGRFVVVELDGPHRVLSTSARTGGEALGVRLLVNHQS